MTKHFLVIVDEGSHEASTIVGIFSDRADAYAVVEGAGVDAYERLADVQVWEGTDHTDTLSRPDWRRSPFLWRSESSRR